MVEISEEQLLEEAEMMVIGSAIENEDDRAELMDRIESSQFYTQKGKRVWEVVREMHREEEVIDLVRLSMRCKQEDLLPKPVPADYIVECSEFEEITQDPTAQADDLIEYDALGKIENAGKRLYENEDNDPKKLTDKAREYFDDITEQLDAGEEQAVSVGDQLTDSINRVNEQEGQTGWTTGLTDLDDIIGPVAPGECCIIAGRPSQGKTSLLRQVAYKVSKDVPCAFFSVEMTSEALTEAYLISETGVRFSDIRKGYISDSQKENVKQAVKSFQSRDLIVDKCNSVDVSHIVNRMRVLHKTEGVEVVFVDYLQLLNASGVDNRQQEVGKVSRRLKQAAKNLDIALFTAAQLNRRVEHRETPQPKLSDLRDSGEIEQDADYVLLLWRPEYYGMQEIDGNPIQEGQARVLIAKQRMGETGVVNLSWIGNKMRFEDFHPEPQSFGGQHDS